MGEGESVRSDQPVKTDQTRERKAGENWNLKTAREYRDRLQRGDTGLVPEIDSTRAGLQEGFAALTPHMTNREIIDDANRLQDKLLAPEGQVGPREKSAIAKTLLRYHAEMCKRLGEAPLDAKGMPQLEGVKWDENSPNKGIIEDIMPFGMIDHWAGYILPEESEAGAPARKAKETATEKPRAKTKKATGDQDHPDATRKGKEVVEGAKMPDRLPEESPRDHMRDFPKRPPKPTDAPRIIAKMAKKVAEAIIQVRERNVQEARAIGTRYSVSILWNDLRKPGNPHLDSGQPYDKNQFHREVRHGTFRDDINRRMPYLRFETGEAAEQAIRKATDTFVDAANEVLRSASTPQERRSVMQKFLTAAEREVSRQSAGRQR